MKTTLSTGDYFGTSRRKFRVTEVDEKNGVYKAQWQGEFWKQTGERQQTSYYSPIVVIPIGEFEKLNEKFTEEGVMAYLPVKMESDYKKNKNF